MRVQPSEDSTPPFSLTTECVETWVDMISVLQDPHLMWLLKSTRKMLQVDYDQRPQTDIIKDSMETDYDSLCCGYAHEHRAPHTVNEESIAQKWTPRVLEPTDLARFLYLAFWHNNCRRFYPWDRSLSMPLVLTPVIIGGVAGVVRLIQSGAMDVGSFLWAFPCGFVIGAAIGLILFGAIFSWIPRYLIFWIYKRQAIVYLDLREKTKNVSHDRNKDGSERFTITESCIEDESAEDGNTEGNALLSSSAPLQIDPPIGTATKPENHEAGRQVQREELQEQSRFMDDFQRGSRLNKAFLAWAHKNVVKPVWNSLIFTQNRMDDLANLGRRRRQATRGGNPDLEFGADGLGARAIAI
ncbi:hypothetical protein G7Y89_g2985 [Cudoniella acicularis]|uniref:Uncharacterized protein n=1 Tax=Cudoniella acicularis TaxID=354080 RepID=A0A8H4RTG2_9HELO|nr:hypothetical protein G7Y89_g2985 [Cudoniella acicularis]